MSSHYRNPMITLSPRTTTATYSVPKFEKTHRRSKSLTSPSNDEDNTTPTRIPITPAPSTPTSMRFTMAPSPVSRATRSRSYTAPSVTPNQSFDSSSLGDDDQSSLSIIGLPSEYPVYQRDDSVSSFASSICSSLLMEELDDFEEFFGKESNTVPPKVYDSQGCSSSDESPLKNERKNYPPLPQLPTKPAHIRTRTMSDIPLAQSTTAMKQPLKRPSLISSRVVSDSSISSSRSESRRRRNHGLDENDFAQLTNDFSSLVVNQ